MLVYLSSYPRSGNTWVRHLIRHYFGYRSASIYPEPQGAPNLERRADGSFELFSYYEVTHSPGLMRPMLVNNCASILSRELRAELAASEVCFFLKTHELPFGDYLEGECVIHIVREPGAVFWSFYNYLRNNEPAYASVTLNRVIGGKVPFGSWSVHSDAWLAAGERLGERFAICMYDDLAADETRVCAIVERMTGLTYPRTIKPLPPFEHWHHKAPTLYRKGQPSEWRSHFSAAQLHRIWKLHGQTMSRLGYDPEVYQIPLLERVLQAVPLLDRRR